MRTKFIQTDSFAEAQEAAPWACEIIEVEGGYMAFESRSGLKTWLNQA